MASFKDILEKTKDIKDCMPSFFDKIDSDKSQEKINIWEHISEDRNGSLTEFQKEVLLDDYGLTEDEVAQYSDWEEFEKSYLDGSDFGKKYDCESMLSVLNDKTDVQIQSDEENIDNIKMEPNSKKEINGRVYQSDDNGNIYMIDGERRPNTTYVLNGYEYKTDDKGRIISSEGDAIHNPDNARDNTEQRKAVDESRRGKDQGGHIDARELNGDSGQGNLVAMDARINQSDYSRMESDIVKALDPPNNKEVHVKKELIYEGDSDRPDKIISTVTIDGKDTIYIFDNNLDNSLLSEVPENGKKTVETKIEETGGAISSIKKEYDEEGKLVKTTVCITYSDEDGNHRAKVVIDGNGGEN